MSEFSSAQGSSRRVLITDQRSALVLASLYNFFCSVFLHYWNSFAGRPSSEIGTFQEAIHRYGAQDSSNAQKLVNFCKDGCSAAEADEAAQALVVATKNVWAVLLQILKLKNIELTFVGDSEANLTLTSPEEMQKHIAAQSRFSANISSGKWTCSETIEFADAVCLSLGPVFSFYGLPPFVAYYRAIALKAAQFEEQGQRLHPELDLLDDRSRSQFLGMMSVLIGVQPSEIMRLKKPEELGGFVDVALGMQSNFSKPLMVTSAAVPLLEDGNTVTSTSPTGVPDYIDLDQSAALVGRSKRTLERRLRKMPPPAIKGSGGKKSEWLWSVMRPWLEKEFGRKLPDRPPHIARR